MLWTAGAAGSKDFEKTGTMMLMLLAFFSWWYGRGWKHVADSFAPRLRNVSAAFSVGQLLKTLFAPWKRIITYPGRSLEEKMRAWADNMFSRVIGFVVRLGVLFAAGVTLFLVAALTLIETIVWPLLPVAVPILIVLGAMA
jgi:hypothetical protein